MKILLTASLPNIDSRVDQRFGRADYFILFDTETNESQIQRNPAVNAAGGAGIRAAQFVASLNPQAVISGEFGPNAFDALLAAGIEMYRFGECDTVQEAIAQYRAGHLARVRAPSGPGKHEHR